MLVLNGAFEFINYPSAKHSFTNPAADEGGNHFNMPLAYNAVLYKASWVRMQDFLKQIFEK